MVNIDIDKEQEEGEVHPLFRRTDDDSDESIVRNVIEYSRFYEAKGF